MARKNLDLIVSLFTALGFGLSALFQNFNILIIILILFVLYVIGSNFSEIEKLRKRLTLLKKGVDEKLNFQKDLIDIKADIKMLKMRNKKGQIGEFIKIVQVIVLIIVIFLIYQALKQSTLGPHLP